jgi:cell division protein ZipA
MEDLRIILAIVGGLVIAGIWFHYRQRGAAEQDDFDSREAEEIRELLDEPVHEDTADDIDHFEDLPRFSATDDVDDDDEPAIGDVDGDSDVPAGSSAQSWSAQRRKPDTSNRPGTSNRKEKIIAMMILPKEPDHRFWGADLMDVFERAGLEYGEFDIFHRMIETNQGPSSVFKVASATEPGSFDISQMPEQYFKGLSLFMVLPGPQRGVDAFADMLATARRIAEQIGGEVNDRNRSTMTRQTAKHVRDELIAFEHGLAKDS